MRWSFRFRPPLHRLRNEIATGFESESGKLWNMTIPLGLRGAIRDGREGRAGQR